MDENKLIYPKMYEISSLYFSMDGIIERTIKELKHYRLFKIFITQWG